MLLVYLSIRAPNLSRKPSARSSQVSSVHSAVGWAAQDGQPGKGPFVLSRKFASTAARKRAGMQERGLKSLICGCHSPCVQT